MVKIQTKLRASPAKERHNAYLAEQKKDSKVRRSSRLQSLQKHQDFEQPSLPSLGHPTLFTIGHGTRTLPELIELLQSAHVTKLLDIRSIPRSFTNPQFNHAMQNSRSLKSILQSVSLRSEITQAICSPSHLRTVWPN
ncbi:HhH-GPD domain-containing protein [Histoplasma capsulatum]|uniref:HhH-GPD domain-containing protein n=1 Tax=Ajellomyces capsulatus TaxID=5037 RepID=A0A8A1MMI8_AJECA|nr:HhH-GPD domain-containing protein [Histoplasma capsulatum]